MELSSGHKELPLVEKLRKNAKSYSFEMASYILESNSNVSFGKEVHFLDAPFRTFSLNSFHMRGTDVEKIEIIDGVDTIYAGRLAISGLNAPLPIPYAELMLRRSKAKDFAMSHFVNIFNSRLLGVSYQISKRANLCLQKYTNDQHCMLTKSIAMFLGNDRVISGRSFSRLAYLFWSKEKSAVGLEAIITSLFQFTTKITQFQAFWADRCDVIRMQNNELKLGINSELGRKVSLSTFGIEIALKSDNYAKVVRLLTDKSYIDDFMWVVERYLGEFFDYTIKVTPGNVPPLVLSTNHDGKARPFILGRTSWIQPPTEERSETKPLIQSAILDFFQNRNSVRN